MSLLTMWFFVILSLFFVIFLFLKHVYTYWDRQDGINSVTPNIPFGNIKSVIKQERSFGLAIYDIYKKVKEPFIGVYLFFRPAILVCDADLIRNILVNDFQHFHDRGVYSDPIHDGFSANLFSLPGEQWITLRKKLTPAFTSGKLKNMFQTFLDVGIELDKHLEVEAMEHNVIEAKDVFSRYVVDVIASVIFGIDVSTIKEPNHEFRDNARKTNEPTFMNSLRRTGVFLCPKLISMLGIKSLPLYMRKFTMNLVTTTIEHREKNNVMRKDLMQFLIQLRNNSDTNADAWNFKNSSTKSLSYENIAAQVFLFYIAGTETSASAISFTLYELAKNPKLMKRVQDEIDEALAKNNGELSYDLISGLEFLDLCIKETTRMYPGLLILNRECTKDYKIPGSKYVITKGTAIVISMIGLHRDEKYFPQADTFDPDRFTDEKHAYNEKAFIPFGEGPRHCVAFRMGRLIAKVALVLTISKYHFQLTNFDELVFDSGSVGVQAKDGIMLKISKRIK